MLFHVLIIYVNVVSYFILFLFRILFYFRVLFIFVFLFLFLYCILSIVFLSIGLKAHVFGFKIPAQLTPD